MPADKTLDDCSSGQSPHLLSSGVPEAHDSKRKWKLKEFTHSEGKEKHLKWELWVKVASIIASKLGEKIQSTWIHVYACVLSRSVMSNSLQPHGLYSLPDSSVYGILQARIPVWVTMPSSRGSSQPRDQTLFSKVSCIGRWVLFHQHCLGNPGGFIPLPNSSHGIVTKLQFCLLLEEISGFHVSHLRIWKN